MKIIQPRLMMAALIASSTVAFAAFSSPAAEAGPILPYGHACLQYDQGGTDCSFTSYDQCLETASGIGAECYGAVTRDDRRTSGAWNGQQSWRP